MGREISTGFRFFRFGPPVASRATHGARLEAALVAGMMDASRKPASMPRDALTGRHGEISIGPFAVRDAMDVYLEQHVVFRKHSRSVRRTTCESVSRRIHAGGSDVPMGSGGNRPEQPEQIAPFLSATHGRQQHCFSVLTMCLRQRSWVKRTGIALALYNGDCRPRGPSELPVAGTIHIREGNCHD